MREILFKALKDDISNCNWVYGQLVYDAIGQPRITEVDSSGKGLTFHTCIKGTECQFTGLLDKNGNKIFEGDTYYTYDDEFDIYIVSFNNGCFCGGKEITNSTPLGWQSDSHEVKIDNWTSEDITIIGNIHD